MEVFDAILKRRSVRKFFSYPIEKEDIFKLLEAADQAPSSGNLDNWQFIVVTDEKTRLELANACNGQFWMSSAPLHIAILSDTKRVTRVYGERGKMYALQNTAAAIENMLLAVEDLGLGACWVGAFHEPSVKEVLKIPDNIDVHAVIAIGPRAVEPPKPKRYDLSAKTFFEEYGKTTKW